MLHQQHGRGASVTVPLMNEKAVQLFSKIYLDKDVSSFKTSSGWLHRSVSGMEWGE